MAKCNLYTFNASALQLKGLPVAAKNRQSFVIYVIFLWLPQHNTYDSVMTSRRLGIFLGFSEK